MNESLRGVERLELRTAWTSTPAPVVSAFNVKDYGAIGDGEPHPLSEQYATLAAARAIFPRAASLSQQRDWAAIQKALDAASANRGGTVYVPEGDYLCGTHLEVTGPNVRMLGVAGRSHLRWVAFGTFTRAFSFWRSVQAGIVADADNFSMHGLKLTGPRAVNTYSANDVLISVCGQAINRRRQRLTVAECELSLSGAYAIQAQFISDVVVDRNWIHDCGYAAVELCSCDNGHVTRNRIKTIQPGTNANMYGIVLDHDSTNYSSDLRAGSKLATNAFCERCVVFDNEVEDVAWEGIDMHGGYENHVIHNRVYDTKMGISCGSGSGTATAYAGYGNVVAYNVIDARKPNGTAGHPERANAQYGINANGGARVTNDDLRIIGNTLVQKGKIGDSSLGAIQVTMCRNAQVSGNILKQWGGVGVICNEGSENVAVFDNQFLDLALPSDNVAIAVYTSATRLPGLFVSRNSLSANGGTAARVGFSGALLRTRPRLSDNEFGAATAARHVLPAAGFLVGNDGPVVITALDGDPTPSIADARGAPHVVVLIPSAARDYAITGFDEGEGRPVADGTCIEIVNTGPRSVSFGRATAVLSRGEEWVGGEHDALVVRKLGAYWREVSRSSNR